MMHENIQDAREIKRRLSEKGQEVDENVICELLESCVPDYGMNRVEHIINMIMDNHNSDSEEFLNEAGPSSASMEIKPEMYQSVEKVSKTDTYNASLEYNDTIDVSSNSDDDTDFYYQSTNWDDISVVDTVTRSSPSQSFLNLCSITSSPNQAAIIVDQTITNSTNNNNNNNNNNTNQNAAEIEFLEENNNDPNNNLGSAQMFEEMHNNCTDVTYESRRSESPKPGCSKDSDDSPATTISGNLEEQQQKDADRPRPFECFEYNSSTASPENSAGNPTFMYRANERNVEVNAVLNAEINREPCSQADIEMNTGLNPGANAVADTGVNPGANAAMATGSTNQICAATPSVIDCHSNDKKICDDQHSKNRVEPPTIIDSTEELQKNARQIHALLPKCEYSLIYKTLLNNQYAQNYIELTLWDLLSGKRPVVRYRCKPECSDNISLAGCTKSPDISAEKCPTDMETASLITIERTCAGNEVRSSSIDRKSEKAVPAIGENDRLKRCITGETTAANETDNETTGNSPPKKVRISQDTINSDNNDNTRNVQKYPEGLGSSKSSEAKSPETKSNEEPLVKKAAVKHEIMWTLKKKVDTVRSPATTSSSVLRPPRFTLNNNVSRIAPPSSSASLSTSILSPPKLTYTTRNSAQTNRRSANAVINPKSTIQFAREAARKERDMMFRYGYPFSYNALNFSRYVKSKTFDDSLPRRWFKHSAQVNAGADVGINPGARAPISAEEMGVGTSAGANTGVNSGTDSSMSMRIRGRMFWRDRNAPRCANGESTSSDKSVETAIGPEVIAQTKTRMSNVETEEGRLAENADTRVALTPLSALAASSKPTIEAQNAKSWCPGSAGSSGMSTTKVPHQNQNGEEDKSNADQAQFTVCLNNTENANKAGDEVLGNKVVIVLNQTARKLYYKLLPMFPCVNTDYIKELCQRSVEDLEDNGELLDEVMLLQNAVERLLVFGSQQPLAIKKPEPEPAVADTYDVNDQYADLLGIFPEADPVYLREIAEQMYNDPEKIKEFVQSMLEQPNYPTRQQYLAKKDITEQQKRYTTDFQVQEFLEVFPDPFSYFEDETRQCQFHPHAVDFLKQYFNKIRVNTLMKLYTKYIHNLSLTVKDLEKLSPNMKTKRCVSTKGILTENIPLLQECAFIQHKVTIRKHLADLKEEEEQEFNELKAKNELFECQCCYDNECMPSKCSTCEDGHIFCNLCIAKSIDMVLANGKAQVDCLINCGCGFSLSVLQRILLPTKFSIFLRKQQEAEVMAAGLEGLVSCPFCHFASIPPLEDKVFKCFNPDCMKESCRLCKKINHVPLKCNEAKSDGARLYLEEKMTQALVRKCQRCGKTFFKEEGCNKMTCLCGAQSCYICDKPVTDYGHFQGQGASPSCSNLCPLWSDDLRMNAESVIKVCHETMKHIKEKDPTVDINVNSLLPKLPPKRRGPHEHIPHVNLLAVRANRLARQLQ